MNYVFLYYSIRLIPPVDETDMVATVRLLHSEWSSGACIQILSPCFGVNPVSSCWTF